MANHAVIQAAIESYWLTFQPKLASVQASFSLTHGGKHWQGIGPLAAPPDDGATGPPNLNKKPTDQAESWADVFTGPNAIPGGNWPAQVTVDVYDGPFGRGYSASVIYTKGGETWSRTFNSGPETWRERPWAGGPTVVSQGARIQGIAELGESPSLWQRFKSWVGLA